MFCTGGPRRIDYPTLILTSTHRYAMRKENVYKQIYLVTFAHSFENSNGVHSRAEIDIIVDNTIRVIVPYLSRQERNTHWKIYNFDFIRDCIRVCKNLNTTRNSPRKG